MCESCKTFVLIFLLLHYDHWLNNKHIRNISLTRNTTTINNKFTYVLQNLLANSIPPNAIKLLNQPPVIPSPFLTCLFPTVSLYLIAAGLITRVAVDAADVWKLQTLAQIVYRYGVAIVWIANVVGVNLSWAIRPRLTTKLRTFPGINWRVWHNQLPFNLLSQPLILHSPFLTTISMTLDWIQSPVATW